MYNTDSPTEGDYVRYQYGGYKLNCQKAESGRGYEYRLTISPVYYSTLSEEGEVDEKVAEILEKLSLGKNASEYEKLQAVYDYICSNVKYDYVHSNNSKYYRDSTAYAALVENYASCQGYAVAVFRLLKELGVECSIVTGTGINAQGESEFHAWNQVLVDGEYYNVDATWDAGKDSYDYFMIKDEEFTNHIF
jgi:transglutaminase/protease-like cytokinesis protein 3